MDHKKIERINELARKKRTVGLTEGEVKEQAALRQEYLDGFKANMQAVLDSVKESGQFPMLDNQVPATLSGSGKTGEKAP